MATIDDNQLANFKEKVKLEYLILWKVERVGFLSCEKCTGFV